MKEMTEKNFRDQDKDQRNPFTWCNRLRRIRMGLKKSKPQSEIGQKKEA
jgi:hypothetical protein